MNKLLSRGLLYVESTRDLTLMLVSPQILTLIRVLFVPRPKACDRRSEKAELSSPPSRAASRPGERPEARPRACCRRRYIPPHGWQQSLLHLPIDLRPAREDIRGFLFLILDELESFDRPLDHALHLFWR